MFAEEMCEEGIVKNSINGIAEIIVNHSTKCAQCNANEYCKSDNLSERILLAKDPYGVMPGDQVQVVIKGSQILLASFLLYGLPLLLFIFGIFIGYNLFNENKELLSTTLAFAIMIFYIVFFLFFYKSVKSYSYPEIKFVSKTQKE